MKLFAKLLGAIALLVSFDASANSLFLDGEPSPVCGGGSRIQLRHAANGDLSIKLINNGFCTGLTFFDSTSGRQIKHYNVVENATSFTLSQAMRDSLSSDCSVKFVLQSRFGTNGYFIVLPWCSSIPTKPKSSAWSYQWSGNDNCKVMINGVFSNRLTTDAMCQGARKGSKDIVSYEYSNNNNCKRMLNGDFSNQLVADAFCDARP